VLAEFVARNCTDCVYHSQNRTARQVGPLAFAVETLMPVGNIIGVSDDVILTPDEITMTLQTAGGPMPLSISLATAEALLVRLRAAADDLHRLQQDRGDPLGKAVVLADKPPLDTVGCMASVLKNGRILLQFRHPSAATTALLVPRPGASILAKTLLQMADPAETPRKR